MEGALSMPPDRGTIIGRAAHSEGIFISVYKTKEDTEPIQQHPVNNIVDCQIQMLAHRKQGPVLPTLIVNVVPDPMIDKARKRRSSRTTGFTASKDSGPAQLMFRPGDDQHSLQDWARFIQQLIQPQIPERAPLSPITPASPTFINPFAPRPRDASDMQPRPDSGNGNGSRPGFFLKSHSQTYITRDRPLTFSDSPSLRSKRSDISSQTSSITQSHMGFHNYPALPADLPSPATTVGEYQGEFIEGWTSAQGRSSALSSPVRGRDSVSSHAPTHLPSIPDSGSPPGPRETILDRAFQLRCIPGLEKDGPVEEKQSSLARFDALMREMDEKRKQREAEEAKSKPQAAVTPTTRTQAAEPRSAFDDDSESDQDSDDEDDDSDGIIEEADDEDCFPPTSAQHALNLMTGRYETTPRQLPIPSRGQGMRSPPSYNHDALMALSSSSSQTRPQTGYSRNRTRPGMAQRTHSQPHLATILASSTSLDSTSAFPIRDSQDSAASFSFTPSSPSARQRSSTEKRQSASSAKRLSFSEFTRRLSSTSSLLLMQTNANSGPASSRASTSDMELQQQPLQSPAPHLHHLHPRAGCPARDQRLQEQLEQQNQQQSPPQSPPPGERCGWRGSVGPT
ncbi:hypothetical protein N0V88_002364 [Collariella sp. IMI 366227]|nr:hypothetical protein N0V88_002364 [Collariella sp. IMI 366227]